MAKMVLMFKIFKSVWRDIFADLKGYELAGVLSGHDIRQRYWLFSTYIMLER